MSAAKPETRVLCLYDNTSGYADITKALKEIGCFVYDYIDSKAAFTQIYNSPPDVLLVSSQIQGWKEFVFNLKNDPVYNHLPVILLLKSKDVKNILNQADVWCDDFCVYPCPVEEVVLRVLLKKNIESFSLDANPLTRLPGNYTIMKRIKEAVSEKQKVSLCYLDLDNFKAFNDRYGFAVGDEAIQMTARIITNVVKMHKSEYSFVGHVGGDDYFFIVPSENTVSVCEQILTNFQVIVSVLISEEDAMRGYFESKDRKGIMQRFPILSLSIAVIDLTVTKVAHTGEVSSLVSVLKKKVKKMPGSNFLIDRRTKHH